jgi:hypothetical protein
MCPHRRYKSATQLLLHSSSSVRLIKNCTTAFSFNVSYLSFINNEAVSKGSLFLFQKFLLQRNLLLTQLCLEMYEEAQRPQDHFQDL